MKIEPLKAYLPDITKISDNDIFFSSVSDKYQEYTEKNYFKPARKDALYAYRISSLTGDYLGLIAGNSLSDIRNHHILPHEKTIAPKEVHLQNLLLARQAQIKPVLCAFHCPTSLHNYLGKICSSRQPVMSIPFERTNELHQLWEISDQGEIDYLTNAFHHEVEKVYIADGHHRCSAVLQLHEKKENLAAYPQNLLVILLPIKDLKIYEYNRVIDLERAMFPEQFLEKLREIFIIQPSKKRITRPKSHVINMLLEGNWYELTWKAEVIEKEKADEFKLDTYLFNKYVIKGIIGVEDVRRDNRITYVPGIYGVPGIKLMVGNNTERIGFMLPKVKKKELVRISNQNLTMPPKSTWFEPRIKNGVVVLPFVK